jgi:hypothetical protein
MGVRSDAGGGARVADLEDLLVSGAELDRQLVAGVLKPVLGIDPKAVRVRTAERWNDLTTRGKILAYLLARKAMKALELPLDAEAAAPLRIIGETGIPKGTVHPQLKGLYEGRPQLVDRDSESRYWIPDWAVSNACDVIQRDLARRRR